jgi:hypothetical protein
MLKHSKRRKAPIETAEYAAMMRRQLRAWTFRVADGNPEDLSEMLAFAAQLDDGIRYAVNHSRIVYATTWAQIGAAAGTTRQAAYQRWGSGAPPEDAA